MPIRNVLFYALVVASVGVQSPSAGQGAPVELDSSLMRDPLRVGSLELQQGSILPGDGFPVFCGALQEASSELGLETAVDLALCANPRVQAAWATAKIRASALGEARAANLPAIKATLGRQSDDTWSLTANAAESHMAGGHASAALTWRLFDFGGREANASAARSAFDAAMATHNAALQKTLVDVIQAYFEAQTAQAARAAKEQGVLIASKTLEIALRKQFGHANSEGDVLQAETRLARARLDLSRANGSFDKVQASLVYLLGASPGTQLKLAELVAPRTVELNRSLTGWLAEAQFRHPSIEAARQQLNEARARAQAVRSEGLPSLDFGAAFYQNGRPSQGQRDRSRERTAGITLNIPIFEGFAQTYREGGANALIEQRSAELRDAELHIAMEVVEAYSDAVAALKNLDASDALLKSARASFTSAQRKYEGGTVNVVESLDSQHVLADAQEERIRCLSEWRSASLRIVAAAGQLGRSELGR